MSQFCTACGKPVGEGAAFCGACGARQAASVPVASPSPVQPPAATVAGAPAVPAPKQGGSALKFLAIIAGVFVFLMVAVLGSCVVVAYRVRHRAQQYAAAMRSGLGGAEPASTTASGMPYLPKAMDKLADSIRKPTSSFHVSFKKATSEGFTYSLEEDVTPTGMTGQETDVSPTGRVGNTDVGGTMVHPRNATVGTPEWQMMLGAMEMSYLDRMNMREAQPGMRYVSEESVGSYGARRYDFDLSSAPASEKAATLLAGKWLGSVVSGATGHRVVLSDYNVVGSAWLANDDGRMVKFQFDYISIFSDGSQKTTHYAGLVSKK